MFHKHRAIKRRVMRPGGRTPGLLEGGNLILASVQPRNSWEGETTSSLGEASLRTVARCIGNAAETLQMTLTPVSRRDDASTGQTNHAARE